MKHILVVAILAITAAGCTLEQQQKWQSVVTNIQQGVRVTTEVARQTLEEVCAQQPLITQGAAVAISIAQSRGGTPTGPKTQAAIRDINTSLAALAAVCSSGNASTSSLASLAVKAWSAYQAVQRAQMQVEAAAGS